MERGSFAQPSITFLGSSLFGFIFLLKHTAHRREAEEPRDGGNGRYSGETTTAERKKEQCVKERNS